MKQYSFDVKCHHVHQETVLLELTPPATAKKCPEATTQFFIQYEEINGGNKMTVQTFNQNENNRDGNIKNEANNMLRSLWLGRQGSNLRMPGSKPGALPLGDDPLLYEVLYHNKQQRRYRLWVTNG